MNLNFMGMFLLLAPLSGSSGLLPNGGAELGIMYMSNVTPVSSDFFTGRYCFQFNATKKWEAIQPWHPVKVTPGKTYTFSAWVRSTDEPCEVGLALRFPEIPGRRKVLMRNTQIGKNWTRIAGSYTVPENVRFVTPRIPVICRAGKGTLLMDDFSVNAPENSLLLPGEIDHKANLTEDAEQGRNLDLHYYNAGSRIDVLTLDFDELRKQGKAVPDELYAKVKRSSDELRREWWSLCQERERFWLDYSRVRKTLPSLLPFREKIADFGRRAAAAADSLEKEAAPLRQGLVYSRPTPPADLWKDRFVLSADYEDTYWGVNRLAYPGKIVNPEYEAKTVNELGLDYLTVLVHPSTDERRKAFLDGFDRYAKAPYLIWSNDTSFAFGKNDMVTSAYFDNREKLAEDIGVFIDRYKSRPGFLGVQVDEPLIRERDIGNRLDKAWEKYLETRSAYLKAHGIDNPRETVEWDIFKGKFMGSHLRFMHGEITKRGCQASICVMPTYEGYPPSRSPYVGSCEGLAQAGTDLYRNGSTMEGLHIQLFKNSLGKGRAILLPGSMYSCKAPDNYKRSISNGIVHADGLHMWTNTHFSKYRNPNTYWRHGGFRPTLDDRRRADLFNWYPWGWDIMLERYRFAAKHNRVLANRESLADVALVVSERVRFLDGKSMNYWRICNASYAELVGISVPFDAIFIENLTEEHYKRYKVIVAPGLRAMTPEERARMEKFAAVGGCIVTTDDFGTQDEWGRPLDKPSKVGKRLPADKAYYGMQEDNVAFAYRLRKDIRDQISGAVEKFSRSAYSVVGLPFGVEVAVQKSAAGNILIHTLDYVGNREVKGHRLRDNSSGRETPLPPFRVHGMTVL